MTDLDRQILRLKARGYSWPIPWEIVELLARKEDCSLVSYLCPSKVWTIGWGETEGIGPNMRWTEDQVDARFYQQVVEFTKKTLGMLTLEPNENQLGAMVSLSYNIGLRRDKPTKGGFYHSSIRRLHNAGDFAGAARAFSLYNKGRDSAGNLVEMRGLVIRRAEEAAIYLRPVDGMPAERMPQVVAEESSLVKSPIAQSGAITIGAGSVTAAASVSDQITETSGVLGGVKSLLSVVKDVVHGLADAFGVPPGALLAIALIGIGYVVMNNRAKQRKDGWS